MLLGYRNMSKLSRKEHLFGISPCFAAIMAGNRKIFKIYLNNKLEEEEPQREHLRGIIEHAKMKNIPILYKSRLILDKLSVNRTHQNIVMQAGRLNYKTLDKNIEPSENDQFWLALDQIQDPMNLGAILRSAAYFGVDKVIVSNKNCCTLTAAVSKASSGAAEWISVYSVNCMKKFLKRSTTSGWDVIGSMGMDNNNIKKSVFSCDNVTINKPSILVVGNEGFGLNDNIAKLCTQMVTVSSFNSSIPLGLDSLNVSVATGVMLHTLIKNRNIYKAKNILQT